MSRTTENTVRFLPSIAGTVGTNHTSYIQSGYLTCGADVSEDGRVLLGEPRERFDNNLSAAEQLELSQHIDTSETYESFYPDIDPQTIGSASLMVQINNLRESSYGIYRGLNYAKLSQQVPRKVSKVMTSTKPSRQTHFESSSGESCASQLVRQKIEYLRSLSKDELLQHCRETAVLAESNRPTPPPKQRLERQPYCRAAHNAKVAEICNAIKIVKLREYLTSKQKFANAEKLKIDQKNRTKQTQMWSVLFVLKSSVMHFIHVNKCEKAAAQQVTFSFVSAIVQIQRKVRKRQLDTVPEEDRAGVYRKIIPQVTVNSVSCALERAKRKLLSNKTTVIKRFLYDYKDRTKLTLAMRLFRNSMTNCQNLLRRWYNCYAAKIRLWTLQFANVESWLLHHELGDVIDYNDFCTRMHNLQQQTKKEAAIKNRSKKKKLSPSHYDIPRYLFCKNNDSQKPGSGKILITISRDAIQRRLIAEHRSARKSFWNERLAWKVKLADWKREVQEIDRNTEVFKNLAALSRFALKKPPKPKMPTFQILLPFRAVLTTYIELHHQQRSETESRVTQKILEAVRQTEAKVILKTATAEAALMTVLLVVASNCTQSWNDSLVFVAPQVLRLMTPPPPLQ